jgi:DNA gyrase subunit B
MRTTERGAAPRWWTEAQRAAFEEYERELAGRLGREVNIAFGDEDEGAIEKADLVVHEFGDAREASRYAQQIHATGVDPRRLVGGDHPGFRIDHKDKSLDARSLRQALETIRKMGQEGVSLQRYKGLGEMNADQLWETTMEPGKRTLLRVRLEDAVRADEMFSILMGSSVEDRRAFIERNALEVSDLDV